MRPRDRLHSSDAEQPRRQPRESPSNAQIAQGHRPFTVEALVTATRTIRRDYAAARL
jgi:hypothetical protein